MIKLRDYQNTAVAEIREALVRYRKVLFCAPCGMGKTICFSYIAQQSQRFNRKVLILSSRCEILMQNGGALESFNLDIDYISPKHKNVPTRNVVVAMAQTLKRRVEKQEWRDYLAGVEFVIIDECHECITDYIHPYLREDVWLLGVTATPCRRSHQAQLGSFYKAMVRTVTVKDLVSMGYLSKSTFYSIVAPSLEGVNIDSGTGDYNKRQLAQRFESKKLYTGIVDEYQRLTPGQKTICFCVSAKQAIDITAEFCSRGVSAQYVLSGDFDSDETYSGRRDDVFDEFRDNKFQVLVNVGVCTAGFDQRDIEVVILNFATVSLSRYLQAVGRGARVTDTKHEFTVLDAGGNYAKFGIYEKDRDFSLWHDEHSSAGVMAMKICDTTKLDCEGKRGCGCMIPISLKVCPNCGYIFRTAEYEYKLHLEKVQEESEYGSIESFASAKRLEGWKINRICVAVCLKDPDNAKKCCMKAYLAINPDKSLRDAERFWWAFQKNVWSKVKTKRKPVCSSGGKELTLPL